MHPYVEESTIVVAIKYDNDYELTTTLMMTLMNADLLILI
jgi:hypothetical protein